MYSFENMNYKLTWSPSTNTNPNCSRGYRVSYLDSSENYTTTMCLIQWTDDTDYAVQVVPFFDEHHVGPDQWVRFRTPGPVQNLTLSDLGDGLAKATWPIPENADHVVDKYVVIVNQTTVCDVNQPLCLLNITYCTDSQIKIEVRYNTSVTRSNQFTEKIMAGMGSEKWNGEVGVELSFHYIFSIQEPGPVAQLQFEEREQTLTISWTAPTVNPFCSNWYKIQVNDKSDMTQEPSFTLSPLEACSTLNTTIRAQNWAGTEGAPLHKLYRTEEQDISPIQNLTLNATSNSLQVNWNVPERGLKCLKEYHVRITDNNTAEVTYNTTNQFVMDDRRIACQKVQVTVTPISVTDKFGETEQAATTIGQRAPNMATPTEIVEASSRYLVLSSSLNDEGSVCKLHQAKLYCKGEPTEPDLVNTIDLGQRIPNGTEPLKFNLTGLQPFENYTCSVRVQNEWSWSKPSHNSIVRTTEDSKFIIIC